MLDATGTASSSSNSSSSSGGNELAAADCAAIAPAAARPSALASRRFSDSVAYTAQGNDLLDFIAAGYTEWRVEKPSSKSGKWQRRMLGVDLWRVYKESNKGGFGGLMKGGARRVPLCGIGDVDSVALVRAGGGAAVMTAGGELVEAAHADTSDFELVYHRTAETGNTGTAVWRGAAEEVLETFRGRAETHQDAEEIVGKIKHLVAIHSQRKQLEALAKHFPRPAPA